MVFEDSFRQIIREEIREALKEHLRPASAAPTGPGDPNERLALTAAGAEFGYAANTLRDWVAKGKVPGHGKGRGLRVKRGELEAFLNGNDDEPSEEELSRRAAAIVRGRR